MISALLISHNIFFKLFVYFLYFTSYGNVDFIAIRLFVSIPIFSLLDATLNCCKFAGIHFFNFQKCKIKLFIFNFFVDKFM